MKKFILLIILISTTTLASSATITLNNGEVVEGVIIKKTSDEIKVDSGIGVYLTYFLDEIKSIDTEKVLDAKNTEQVPPKTVFSNDKEKERQAFVESFRKYIKEGEIVMKTQQLFEDSLQKFNKEFPKSIYADDALFISIVSQFQGSATARTNKENADIAIKEIEVFLNRYPKKKLEELTYIKWKEIFIKTLPAAFYIEYKFVPFYMKGFMGFEFGNFDETIKNYTLIKNKIDFSKDNSHALEAQIYLPLIIAHKKLGNSDKVKEIANEAITKFPNNSKLIETIKYILN